MKYEYVLYILYIFLVSFRFFIYSKTSLIRTNRERILIQNYEFGIMEVLSPNNFILATSANIDRSS